MFRRIARPLCLLVLLTSPVSCTTLDGDLQPDAEAAGTSRATDPELSSPQSTLAEGWAGFVQGLERARQHLEDPRSFPPEPTDRNLAEGYRYLLGHLARIIEQETEQDPDFPAFQRAVRMLSKWTIDNPDTMYLTAAIDADGIYRVRGRALDTSAWRTGTREARSPIAPRVVIFQTTTAIVGQTGELAEMAACRNQTLDALDQFDLELDAEGRFELIIAAERPADWEGPFLTTRAEAPCRAPDGTLTRRTRDATVLTVREIFSDWEHEVPLDLEITRLDMLGATRPPRSASEMARNLSEIGRLVANQIVFWNRLHELGLEIRGDRNGDGRRALPLNGLNPPSPPFIAGGTAGAGQLYAAGTAELNDDEALVIRVATPREPYYLGFQLANPWGESVDQANYVSSQTASQNPVASDGARYYVVSARDPGTPGWLDTTGLERLTLSMRFIYEDAPPSEAMPSIETFTTRVEDVRDHLPPDTPLVSAEDRRREIELRQRHIQRRWRQY
jgi:hypothetical protein